MGHRYVIRADGVLNQLYWKGWKACSTKKSNNHYMTHPIWGKCRVNARQTYVYVWFNFCKKCKTFRVLFTHSGGSTCLLCYRKQWAIKQAISSYYFAKRLALDKLKTRLYYKKSKGFLQKLRKEIDSNELK